VYDLANCKEQILGIIWILIGLCTLVLVLLFLWLRERRKARVEQIAYGLRGGEDADQQTITNITEMQAELVEAIAKLEELDLIKQDEWGRWFWVESGNRLGSSVKKD
jgi:hypothetical protein